MTGPKKTIARVGGAAALAFAIGFGVGAASVAPAPAQAPSGVHIATLTGCIDTGGGCA